MVYYKELIARVKAHYTFEKQEWAGLLVSILVGGLIFSFRDWGAEQFDATQGFTNLITMIIIVAISLWFKFTCQKIYGLGQGHQATFKVWWLGLGISLIICFLTLGRFPLILMGGMVTAFMVKLRLGEFRYGFSYWVNGMIGMWGVFASLLLALIFATLSYYYPASYFFSQGIIFNILLAWCTLIPLPQMDGFNIFFGSRYVYLYAIVAVAVATVLLMIKFGWALVLAWAIALIWAIVYYLIGSER
jgi:hypothetical protein